MFIFSLVIAWCAYAQESASSPSEQAASAVTQEEVAPPTIAQILKAGQIREGSAAVAASPANDSDGQSTTDEDGVEEEIEPLMTIGSECVYPGTFVCRCGDTHMGCIKKEKCKGYCSID